MSKYIDAELLRKEILEHKEKTPSGFDRHNEIVQILAILDRQPDVGRNKLCLLSFEQLKQMVGKPVYEADCKLWGIVDFDSCFPDDLYFCSMQNGIRITWAIKARNLKLYKYEAALANVNNSSIEPIPIEDMGFSVRTYNCLKRVMINTLQDLSEQTVEDLQRVRNLGIKSLNEIIDRCKEYGVDIIAKELKSEVKS